MERTTLERTTQRGGNATLVFVGLICTGVVFGLTLAHVLQDPGSRGLDAPAWLRVQHTFYGGFAVVGGVGEIAGLLATAAAAAVSWAHRRRAEGVRLGIAALCMLGTLVAYFVGNRPVNARIAAWTPSTLPADWSDYRATWETAHAVSAGLSAVAFVLVAVCAVWGLRVSQPRR